MAPSRLVTLIELDLVKLYDELNIDFFQPMISHCLMSSNYTTNKWQGPAFGARSVVRKNITHRKQTEKQEL